VQSESWSGYHSRTVTRQHASTGQGATPSGFRPGKTWGDSRGGCKAAGRSDRASPDRGAASIRSSSTCESSSVWSALDIQMEYLEYGCKISDLPYTDEARDSFRENSRQCGIHNWHLILSETENQAAPVPSKEPWGDATWSGINCRHHVPRLSQRPSCSSYPLCTQHCPQESHLHTFPQGSRTDHRTHRLAP
jgi:hypothetical protein